MNRDKDVLMILIKIYKNLKILNNLYKIRFNLKIFILENIIVVLKLSKGKFIYGVVMKKDNVHINFMSINHLKS